MIKIPNYIEEYYKKWKQEVQKSTKMSPKMWGFVSFIAPLVAAPLAMKAVSAIGKEIKKRMK